MSTNSGCTACGDLDNSNTGETWTRGYEAGRAEDDRLRQAVEALAADIKRDANDDWTAHNEAAHMSDLHAAELHGEAGEVRDDIAARLRDLLDT